MNPIKTEDGTGTLRRSSRNSASKSKEKTIKEEEKSSSEQKKLWNPLKDISFSTLNTAPVEIEKKLWQPLKEVSFSTLTTAPDEIVQMALDPAPATPVKIKREDMSCIVLSSSDETPEKSPSHVNLIFRSKFYNECAIKNEKRLKIE